MKFGVVIFPGSNCDHDTFHVLRDVLSQPTEEIWHQSTELGNVDAVILPGGFAYGDYLRTGAIASHSPVMGAVKKFAAAGGLVLGIVESFCSYWFGPEHAVKLSFGLLLVLLFVRPSGLLGRRGYE